jgi:8-oxo-dGTP pyrophosphatase MutT (NUDIX family)
MNTDREQFQTLSDVIPHDLFIGTSLIIRQGNRFLYGIRSTKQAAGRKFLEITGIGGGLEAQDPSLFAGALRESVEETGCRVNYRPCPTTLIVRGPDQVERAALTGDERPAAVVFRNHRTPPHQPWDPVNQGEACLIVFLADLEGQPRPSMELPYLIWLQPEHILRTAWQDVHLGELLDTGAKLITGNSPAPPKSNWSRMTDSQEALAIALGEAAPSFYRSL